MNEELQQIVRGGVELHVHADPDFRRRYADVVDLALEYREAGFSGLVYKHHLSCSAGTAYAATRMTEPFHVYGALCLNYTVGGLNPMAVSAAAALGARIVYLPTMASRHHLQREGLPEGIARFLPPDSQGLTVLGEDGELVGEAKAVIEAVAETGMVLASGHMSPEECRQVVPYAIDAGVRAILITHASHHLSGIPVEDQVRFAQMGAWIEQSYAAIARKENAVSAEDLTTHIRRAGVERTVLSSDFGQQALGSPVRALLDFVSLLRQQGFTPEELRQMVVDNPRRVLGLPPYI